MPWQTLKKWATDALQAEGVYNFTDSDIKRAESDILRIMDAIRTLLNKSLKEHGKTVAYCVSITNTGASHFFQKCHQCVPNMDALKALEHGGAITVSDELLDTISKYEDAINELRYMNDCRKAYKVNWKDVIKLNKPRSIYRRLELFADCLKQNTDRITISNGEYNAVKVLPDDVIYLDPPYQDKTEYISGKIDYKALTEWIKKHAGNPVYISEMANAPWLIEAGFSKIWQANYRNSLANNKKARREYKPRIEALWCNEAGLTASYEELIQPLLPGVEWF